MIARTERSITTAILRRLNALEGCYFRKTFGGAHAGAGWPDIIGSVETRDGTGAFVALEVKRPGGKPTPLQVRELQKWRNTGAEAEVVTNVDEAETIVRDMKSWP